LATTLYVVPNASEGTHVQVLALFARRTEPHRNEYMYTAHPAFLQPSKAFVALQRSLCTFLNITPAASLVSLHPISMSGPTIARPGGYASPASYALAFSLTFFFSLVFSSLIT
jgi:hypothetical protein